MRVAIWPGQTALKRTAWPNSSASDAVSAISAALLAAYGREALLANLPGDRRDRRHRAPTRDQPVEREPRDLVHGPGVHGEDVVPVGEIAGRERDPAGLPRRVDERRQAAVAERQGAVHDLRRSRGLRDVRRHELRRRDGARDGVAGGLIAAAEDDAEPVAGEPLDAGPADPVRAAGDERRRRGHPLAGTPCRSSDGEALSRTGDRRVGIVAPVAPRTSTSRLAISSSGSATACTTELTREAGTPASASSRSTSATVRSATQPPTAASTSVRCATRATMSR